MACELTPNSVSRLQSLASMSFYTGDVKEAKAVGPRHPDRPGLEDVQPADPGVAGVLRLGAGKGLERCRADLRRLMERHPDSVRLKRNEQVIETLIKTCSAAQRQGVNGYVNSMRPARARPTLTSKPAPTFVTLCAHMSRLEPGPKRQP